MAIKFNRSQTFATNGTVTAAGLHNLVDGLDIYQALITDQTNLTSVGTADELLIADADLTANDAPRAVTVQELFNDALTVGTYTDANFTANLTYGTATGNRTVNTNASITTGTINNATLGTTTGTAATFTSSTLGTTTATAANITNGTIQKLTSSTATITGGTFSGSINSTAGTIASLNSTNGTISNLTTTITGDFTISGGIGTLGTTGVTAGTYGTNTSAVTLTLDSKGRITTISTSQISSSPSDGSITYVKLSTSTTESENVASRTAKAWVNFNGTGTVSIRSDFNVSSITDVATGKYAINFSTSLPDANYCIIGGVSRDGAESSLRSLNINNETGVTPLTTGSANILVGVDSASDQAFITAAFFSL